MTTQSTEKETRRATIKNHGHGLPNAGETVLLDGEGLTDAITIRRIITVAEPTRARNGQFWQPSMTVEGNVIRNVGSVEFCVSEYIATARLLPTPQPEQTRETLLAEAAKKDEEAWTAFEEPNADQFFALNKEAEEIRAAAAAIQGEILANREAAR